MGGENVQLLRTFFPIIGNKMFQFSWNKYVPYQLKENIFLREHPSVQPMGTRRAAQQLLDLTTRYRKNGLDAFPFRMRNYSTKACTWFCGQFGESRNKRTRSVSLPSRNTIRWGCGRFSANPFTTLAFPPTVVCPVLVRKDEDSTSECPTFVWKPEIWKSFLFIRIVDTCDMSVIIIVCRTLDIFHNYITCKICYFILKYYLYKTK